MATSTRIARRVARQVVMPLAEIPTFLCPAILRTTSIPLRCTYRQSQSTSPASQRRSVSSIPTIQAQGPPKARKSPLEELPQQCAGCGALSQTVDSEGPGYYTLTRKSVKTFVEGLSTQELSAEDEVVKAALERAGTEAASLNLGDLEAPVQDPEPPVCDRCHKLKHHETGVSIHHPSIQSIQDTIFESPYKYNHVYHVIDAADFPMSLVPGLQKLLHITPQRSLNRRSKTGRFYHGRRTEVSFIITRSDLLAPLKIQVDQMMPYLREVLRDALGRSAKDVRLGNVRCVSAKQAWWTKELKEEIWSRGGAGWMVGKVNVGKSQLFHEVFPKGRKTSDKKVGTILPARTAVTLDETKEIVLDMVEANSEGMEVEPESLITSDTADSTAIQSEVDVELQEAFDKLESSASSSLDTSSLLPPAPIEVDYPSMPLVSSLPGTTASPIRLPFGNGKGELIDLPGLSRGDLELHVQPEHRSSLVMRSRIQPEQQTIRPRQSLLLGGFIRITATDPNVLFLSYSFTPIEAHVTSTEKAIGTQTQTRESALVNISLSGTGEKIKSAGVFPLKWDVTRQRTGPITSRKALGIRPENLPYKVLATDILIEGCGWVELVAQVRKKPGEVRSFAREWKEEFDRASKAARGESEDSSEIADDVVDVDADVPAVEVFSPEGRFIASRRPMNAWLYVAGKPTKGKLQGRPRKSMKGVKKAEKKRSNVGGAAL
ncbi:hypothetical protein ONS95_004013 [Cadophora gregata]|uniref:uncharacterized protein n=1 Tax=Cadophora gregata TaxID=51156 RepID=UPI0026DB02E3|nr:uncharacterized protein ONS95_004013 [Cadophora gregata]KAK0107319.1 hypothetical protein ONS95_004013 [Cadophora gregata]KAK0117000.1 hypothetical protein ONS96_012841 [Cadophora gregata f. sp. sojae]